MSEKAKPKKRMRIHYLVEAPADGPNVSKPAQGNLPIGGRDGEPTRWRFACDPAGLLGPLDRGTGEPHAVMCDACKATPFFPEDSEKPGLHHRPEQMVADGSACC